MPFRCMASGFLWSAAWLDAALRTTLSAGSFCCAARSGESPVNSLRDRPGLFAACAIEDAADRHAFCDGVLLRCRRPRAEVRRLAQKAWRFVCGKSTALCLGAGLPEREREMRVARLTERRFLRAASGRSHDRPPPRRRTADLAPAPPRARLPRSVLLAPRCHRAQGPAARQPSGGAAAATPGRTPPRPPPRPPRGRGSRPRPSTPRPRRCPSTARTSRRRTRRASRASSARSSCRSRGRNPRASTSRTPSRAHPHET